MVHQPIRTRFGVISMTRLSSTIPASTSTRLDSPNLTTPLTLLPTSPPTPPPMLLPTPPPTPPPTPLSTPPPTLLPTPLLTSLPSSTTSQSTLRDKSHGKLTPMTSTTTDQISIMLKRMLPPTLLPMPPL